MLLNVLCTRVILELSDVTHLSDYIRTAHALECELALHDLMLYIDCRVT